MRKRSQFPQSRCMQQKMQGKRPTTQIEEQNLIGQFGEQKPVEDRGKEIIVLGLLFWCRDSAHRCLDCKCSLELTLEYVLLYVYS